jgi:hypothetical protein
VGVSLFSYPGGPLGGPTPLPLGGPVGGSLVGVTLGVILVAGVEGARLARGGMPRPPRLALLLVLAAVAPALGTLAAVTGLHAVALELSRGGGMDAVQAMERGVQDGALLATGILVGLVGALAWFGLREGRARRAVRNVAALLSGDVRGALPPQDIVPLVTRRKT